MNIRVLVVAAGAASLAGGAWAQCRVGVVWGGAAAGPETVGQLADNTYGFGFSVYSLGAGDVDTLAEAQQYDVLVLGASGFGNDTGYTDQMLASLRQFKDAGGGIVTTGWWNYWNDFIGGQGAADADYISPIDQSSYQFQQNPTIQLVNGPHPITNGLSDFSISTYSETTSGVDGTAGILGNANGQTAIAYDDQTNGRTVYLGPVYLANTGYGNGGLRSGSADQLLEQAVNWACGAIPAPGAGLTFALGGLAIARRRR